jgi:hypothetical protein
MANPVDRWLKKYMSALLLFIGSGLLLVPASPEAMVDVQLDSQPSTSASLLEKSPLEQLILPLNSRNFWTWMSASRLLGGV